MLKSERSLESELDDEDRKDTEKFRRALEEVGPRLVTEWDADLERNNAQLVSSLEGLSQEERDQLRGTATGWDAIHNNTSH